MPAGRSDVGTLLALFVGVSRVDQLPKLRVFQKSVIATHCRADKAGPSVEEAAAYYVHGHEFERPGKEKADSDEARVTFEFLAGQDSGEVIDRSQVGAKIGVRVVEQVEIEVVYLPPDLNSVMGIRSAPAAPVASEEADLAIRVPPSVTNPATEILVEPIDPEARERDVLQSEDSLDFCPQRLRHSLIRIDAEHPGVGSLIDGEILLLDVPGPRSLDHPVGEFTSNLHCLIGTQRVDDDDLVTEANALKALPEIRLFVLGDDTRSE